MFLLTLDQGSHRVWKTCITWNLKMVWEKSGNCFLQKSGRFSSMFFKMTQFDTFSDKNNANMKEDNTI